MLTAVLVVVDMDENSSGCADRDSSGGCGGGGLILGGEGGGRRGSGSGEGGSRGEGGSSGEGGTRGGGSGVGGAEGGGKSGGVGGKVSHEMCTIERSTSSSAVPLPRKPKLHPSNGTPVASPVYRITSKVAIRI